MLDDDFYGALGHLVVTSSILDRIALRLLQVLSGGNSYLSALLLDDMPSSKVLDKMRVAAGIVLAHRTDVRDAVREWVKAAHKVRIDRNAMVHGEWDTDAEGGGYAIMTRPRATASGWDFESTWREVSVDDMHDLTGRTIELGERGIALWEEVRSVMKPTDE